MQIVPFYLAFETISFVFILCNMLNSFLYLDASILLYFFIKGLGSYCKIFNKKKKYGKNKLLLIFCQF